MFHKNIRNAVAEKYCFVYHLVEEAVDDLKLGVSKILQMDASRVCHTPIYSQISTWPNLDLPKFRLA